MKKICILGSTGSIGTQTLDVVRLNTQIYEVDSLVAGRNADVVISQAKEFHPKVVAMADLKAFAKVKNALSTLPIEVVYGEEEICSVASRTVDIVVGAITGANGFAPVLSAIKAGNNIALANKESLVCGGDMLMSIARKKGVQILPVDSEHSALFQVYNAPQKDSIDKITLTASGGAFLHYSKDEIRKAGVSDALNHPKWSMGKKVTVDSAGLMNKGLELIEACHLFDVGEDIINVVVHPQSIVHSMISYNDGSTLAQLGYPDMRTPIAVALAYPSRIVCGVESLNFTSMGNLTFREPDNDRFPALNLCRQAFKNGGGSCMVLNTSNEVAVEAFLQKKIEFGIIARIVEKSLNTMCYPTFNNLEDFKAMNAEIRIKTTEILKG